MFLKTKFSFSKIFLSLLFLVIFFAIVPAVSKAATREVTGWARSNTIGWISFSTKDCDKNNNGFKDTNGITPYCNGNDNSTTPNRSYGVYLDDVSGNFLANSYAWSDNIGWIRFDGLSGFPNVAGTQTQSNSASIVTSGNTRQLSGWARACAGTTSGNCSNMTSRIDGWDGWISLRGSNNLSSYSVTVDHSTSGDFHGYAWGSDVVGWIKFNCIDTPGECAISNYKVTIGSKPEPQNIVVSVINNNSAEGYVTAPNTSTTEINCGFGSGKTDCEHTYSSSQNVTLSARTTAGNFAGWGGGALSCGTVTPCTVAVGSTGAYITATFNNGAPPPPPPPPPPPETCSDGIRNQNETGIDTGGVCSGDGGGDGGGNCSDGIKNQDETGVDTGGVCGGGGVQPLVIPSGLNAMTGLCETGTITLRWSTVNGASYYNLLRDNSDFIRVDGGGTSSYADENLGVSETHNYKIRACDSSNNCSAYSASIDAQSPAMCNTLPPVTCSTSDWRAPENFMATKGNCSDNGDITLTWNDTSDETHYEVYRSTSFINYPNTPLVTIGANQTFYNDKNDAKNSGQRYYYAIRSCKAGNECSNYSYYDAETPSLSCDNTTEGEKNLHISVVGSGWGQIMDNWTRESWTASGGRRNTSGSNSCDKNDTNSTSIGCDIDYNYYNNASRYLLTTIDNWTTSPGAGSAWGGWIYGSCAGSRCPMSQDHVAIGRFDSNSYSKISVCEPVADGVCGSAISGSYENPPQTNLCSVGLASAVTDGGTTWNWVCNGSGGGTNDSCSAAKINRVTLSAVKSGNGFGVITSNPSGINCGSDCSESYDQDSGARVTLKATANGGSTFTSWSGVSCEEGNNSGNTCTTTMNNSNVTVNAAFISGFVFGAQNAVIFATIVEGLNANSSETDLTLTGQATGNVNLSAVLPNAINKPQTTGEFSEDNGTTWKNILNFPLSSSKTTRFRIRNILSSTSSGTYPITIQARDNAGYIQTATVNLNLEKITTQWQEI